MTYPTITLYSTPTCRPCRTVAAWLEQRDIAFRKVDVTADPAAHQELVENGFRSTPVVQVGELWILGFNPDAMASALEQD